MNRVSTPRWIRATQSVVAAISLALAGSAIAAPVVNGGKLGIANLQLGSAFELGSAAAKGAPDARAQALAAADFDADGFPDLAAGYAVADGGLVTVHRGNREAWAPTLALSQALIRAGQYPPGFVSEAVSLKLPVAPELMASGDFDHDGNADLVIAKRGDTAVYLLRGGAAGLGAAQKLAQPGAVDALAAGNIDRPDGFADLAVAVSSKAGASLQIYTAGIDAKARTQTLPAAASEVHIGQIDASPMGDIAVLSAGKVLLLHGVDRSARTAAGDTLEALDFAFAVQTMALGEFIWDRDGATELALLKDDGTIHIAARGALNTAPFTVEEVRALRRAQHAATSAAVKSWQPGSDADWRIAESIPAQMSKASTGASPRLLTARLSGQPADDLLAVDALGRAISVLTVEGQQRKSAQLAATVQPIAALSLQTSAFVRPSLVVLGAGAAAATVLPSAPNATFSVSKTADTNDGTCNADCSLREAIGAANAAAGADTVLVPAGTYTLTIVNAGGINEDNNATGDLDVNGDIDIQRVGAGAVIIQAGTTNSNGIDKVIAFNPVCISGLTMSIGGVTVRFGRNSQPSGAADFSFTGGGIDVCNTGTAGFTMTNVVVDQNSVLNGYGGGVNLDSFAANGTFSISGSTISSNQTTSTASIVKNGGGINLFADQHNVNITNTTISGNISAGEGGGVFVRHTNGGAITISGSTISNNTAASRGGGVSNINLGTSSLTINNDSVISNNVSQGTAAGTESRGGGVFSSASSTSATTIRETTITGNQAASGVTQFGGGIAATGGTITAQFNRISGNTAGSGSGFHNAGATVTGTRNWWGCNAGPGAAPCDRSVNASGTLGTTPHLILRHVASPNTIFVTQTSTLTADFLRDSGGGVIAVADLDALIGTSHLFNGAALGNLSAAQTSIQANGTATATFTATGAGAGGANSVVDAHTEPAAITINRFNSTTLITSDLPDPSIVGAAVPVNFTVTPVAPGVVAPTGNVVVTVSGGGETCTGTVAAGTCSITLTVGGNRTLTATYAGDTLYNSSSDTEAHNAVVCPSTIVTNGNDTGAGSLRDVVANACVGSTITFQAGVSTVTLTSAEISINKNLTIDGGASLVTVTRSTAGGTPNFRIFNVLSGNTVSMNALTVSNGNHPSQAGGIQNSGSLTLTNMHITGNRSPQSGGLQNDSVLNLSNSSVTNNVASSFAGGMAIAGAGTTTLANCTFSGNQGGSDSGAIGAGGTSLTITNCTISGNTLVLAGGLGAGITINGVPTTIRNTILAGNTEGSGAQSNVDGSLQAASAFNVLGTGPAGGLVNGTNNNQVGVSTALLGSLANYGGLTPTLPLLPGSVAINTGTAVSAPASDQRGVARVGTTDIGAFESRGFSVTQTSGSPQTTVVNTAFASPLVATVASANSEPVTGGVVSFTPPGSGASAVLGSPTATIAASGQASTSATANATTGNYTVSANTSGNLGSAVSFSLTNRDLSANLSITKTNGTASSVPGGSTTYTITASNAGPDPVTGATAADTFPASLTCNWTCVGAGGGTCTASGSGNINSSANLPVGASVTYTASCAIGAAATGTLSNTATITSSIADPTPADNSATDTDTLTPQADVSITKTDGQTSVNAGTNTTYTITASNAGPSNAPGTTVADTFPAACTSVGWTCVGSGGGTCPAGGSGNINQVVNLPSGGSVAFSATCAVSTGATGTLSNTATVTVAGGITDPVPGNNSATDISTINDFPTLAINDVSITEGNSGTQVLNFTVTRTGITASAVGFNFATADNTATVGSDYVAASGTGTIAAGGATGSTQVAVTINGDAVFENNETFFVNLSAPTNATLADGQGLGTITNDDTAPTLSINDVSIVEGNSGTSNLVFTVTRTGLTALPASFSAATLDGTATAPSDYLAALVGSTTIAAGGATGTTTLTATINGDAVVEANETFFVNLSAPGNATIADNQGAGTITNDDTAGIVLVQSGGSTDVTEGGVTDSYTLVLTSQPTGNVSVALNPDAQVTAATSPVVFTSANWATPQIVTVTAVDDAAIEGPHTGTITHFVTSADPTYNGFPVANVVANITDNDLPTLAINDVSIAEGNAGSQTLTFTVTRTGATASAVGFSFATANNTATIADSDYVAASGSGNIPSGGASATTTIAVTINGDATFENTESFFVNLSAPTNATIADAQGVGTITNDDAAPTLAINDVSIVEGNSGTQNLVFTVTRTGLTALPANFTAVTADGTASAPSDYLAALAGSASIAAGGATGTTTLTATINGDFIVEANETFFVNLSAPGNATIADNQGTGSITNDDTAGISVVQSGGTTNVTEGGATDTYTLVLTSQPTGDVSVALNGGAQVTPSPTPLLFTSGNWNLPQTVTVTAVDDPVVEGNHSGSVASVVTSSDGNYNGLVVAPVSVAITDNDTPGVTLVQSGGDTQVTEGGATDTYTMVLTSQPSANVTVTPNGGTQLTNPPAVVFTNANWNLPQTVTVTATDDNVVEGTHSGSMTHTVASADSNYAGLVVGQVSASITDNDSAVVAFNPISVSQTEGTSPMAFAVTLSNPVASGVTLTLNSTPGTATAADFTPIVGGTVTFAANSTANQTVNVVITNDALDENDESFTLTLSGVTAVGNVSLGAASATGTILDDDPTPTLSISSPSQPEGNAGNTPMNFVVSLSTISGRDVTFTRATADGTATVANNDYQPLAPQLITIPAGQLSTTIAVQIVGDAVFEGNESFSLNLTGIANATPASLTGTGTLVDDDQQPTTTTITSDTPDPTVVGQPYTVAVNVAAVTSSPLGTVTISDGSASCGPVTLTTATAPNSTASCSLTSTSAGAKTLTASYTPASTAFAASSGTTAHQVNAAATAISVVGPARSRINQPTTFTFALSVNAPGAGSPAGTVTLSSGAATCAVTVPTGTPSCALSFNTLGPRTVTAAFAPSDGNFLASSSSGAGNAQTLVYAQSDIAVTKTDLVATYRPGDLLVYTVTVRNLGPDAAAVIRVRDQVPAGVVNVDWTCDASGGVACPAASGSGNLDLIVTTFPVGGLLNFTFFGNVSGSPAQIVNTALVELPADTTIEDPNLGNNSASDTDLLEFLFQNGFESPAVSAPAGSYRLPSLALRGALDEAARVVYVLDDANGEALRVYARLLDGQVQYALAGRNGNGELRLAAWISFTSEPTLSWTARQAGAGWVLETVTLR